jgi:hypothetical protein
MTAFFFDRRTCPWQMKQILLMNSLTQSCHVPLVEFGKAPPLELVQKPAMIAAKISPKPGVNWVFAFAWSVQKHANGTDPCLRMTSLNEFIIVPGLSTRATIGFFC